MMEVDIGRRKLLSWLGALMAVVPNMLLVAGVFVLTQVIRGIKGR